MKFKERNKENKKNKQKLLKEIEDLYNIYFSEHTPLEMKQEVFEEFMKIMRANIAQLREWCNEVENLKLTDQIIKIIQSARISRIEAN